MGMGEGEDDWKLKCVGGIFLLLWGVEGLVSMLRAGEGKWNGRSSR